MGDSHLGVCKMPVITKSLFVVVECFVRLACADVKAPEDGVQSWTLGLAFERLGDLFDVAVIT